MNAVEAASSADPYPFYEQVRATRPFAFDDSLKLWVASTASVIDEVLAHPDLLVRPPGELVPRALQGTPTGDVFAHLVRMNDGDFHAAHRPVVVTSTSLHAMPDVAQHARAAVNDLAERTDANALLTRIPVQTMARLLGVARESLDATVTWVEDFVQGIGASASPEVIARSNLASVALMAQGEALGLDEVRSANRIAMMQQSLDATAGLVGNTIRVLQSMHEFGPESSLTDFRELAQEVARWDAPVQNTRRFAARDVSIAGGDVKAGQGILVLLASGNRDPALNDNADMFEASRTNRRMFTFGAGRHRCPGDAIAIEIAAAAIESLEKKGDTRRLFDRPTGFRALPNARIPVFAV